MENLKENGVPLIIYDRALLNGGVSYYSYALYSKQEMNHEIAVQHYDCEVFGPNGFFRKFKGGMIQETEVLFVSRAASHKAEFIFRQNKKGNISFVLEDLYENSRKNIPVHQTEQKMTVDLAKNKGWYDFKITSGDCIWHFAGRIENGKVSVSDPHWI